MPGSSRIDDLKRRVQSDPASIAFATLAEEYRRAGRYQEAIDTCRSGLERHPSYISAHVTLGRALLEVGEYAEAREELELVLRVAPENLAAIRGLAEIHHRYGDAPDTRRSSPTAVVEVTGVSGTDAAASDWEQARPSPPAEPLRGGSAAAQAPIPVATQQFQPVEDRALAGLEEFLQAIMRARKAGGGIHVV